MLMNRKGTGHICCSHITCTQATISPSDQETGAWQCMLERGHINFLAYSHDKYEQPLTKVLHNLASLPSNITNEFLQGE